MKEIKAKTWNGRTPAVYAHLKLDGHYTRVVKTGDEVRFTTSNPTDITTQIPDHIKEPLRQVPDGIDLLGELFVPGQPASYVKSALKGDSDKLRLVYFANLKLAPNLPLEALEAHFQAFSLPFAEYISLEPGWSPIDLMGRAIASGAEGWMLKNGNLENWMKFKAVQTVDCVVTDTEEGKGKYLGLIGALVVSVYKGDTLVEIANVSGMDDATREAMSETSPVGRVVEVEYQYVGAGGRLRHPRFKCFRDDKLPEECRHEDL